MTILGNKAIPDPSQLEILGEADEISDELEEPTARSVSESAITTTDWTVETLVRQIEKGNIELNPDFQRRFAWTDSRKSEFIESLVLRYPVPAIVLSRNQRDSSRFIVLDGKQRLMTLAQFYGVKKIGARKSGLSPLKLTKLKIKESWSKETFASLNKKQGEKPALTSLENTSIRAVIIQSWNSEDFLYSVFVRLNQGSLPLSPQELRQALRPGPFTKFADEYSANSAGLRKLLGLSKPDFRMRDVELLVRFLSFRFRVDTYKGSLKAFLDDTCEEFNTSWATTKPKVLVECAALEAAINLAVNVFGENHMFRKYVNGAYEPRINRAIFDIVAYTFADANIRSKLKTPQKRAKLKEEFESLCAKPSFLKTVESTTKSLEATKGRFTQFLNMASKVTGHKVPFDLK